MPPRLPALSMTILALTVVCSVPLFGVEDPLAADEASLIEASDPTCKTGSCPEDPPIGPYPIPECDAGSCPEDFRRLLMISPFADRVWRLLQLDGTELPTIGFLPAASGLAGLSAGEQGCSSEIESCPEDPSGPLPEPTCDDTESCPEFGEGIDSSRGSLPELSESDEDNEGR